MVALPDVPNGGRIRIFGSHQGVGILHLMHFAYTGTTLSQGNAQAVADGIRSTWNASIAAIAGTQTNYTLFEVADLSSRSGVIAQNNVAVVGTAASTSPAAVSICLVVSWTVGYRYRGGHPRTYFPLSSQNLVTDGRHVSTGTTNSHAAAWNAWLQAFNAITLSGSTCTLTYYSFYSGHTADGKPIVRPTPVPHAITGARVTNRIDTQRRRLGKG